MRIAVISDIHSNYLALENALCIVDSMRPDAMIFLGDYLTDFPYPQYTLRLLDECAAHFPCWFVRGNREDYLLRHRADPNDGWKFNSSSGSLLYTYENLLPIDIEKIAGIPVSQDIDVGGGLPLITACHASPRATKEWIMNRPALIDKYTSEMSGSVLLCGHTHKCGVAEANGKRVIFCPSVGLPQDHRRGSKFLMLENRRGMWRYRTIVFDFDKAKMEGEFKRSGLMDKAGIWAHCIIRSMYEERDLAARCVALAWRIASLEKYEGGQVLPEEYWVRAATELHII